MAYNQLKVLESLQALHKQQPNTDLARPVFRVVPSQKRKADGTFCPEAWGQDESGKESKKQYTGFSTNVAEFLFRPEVVKDREPKPKQYKRYQSSRTPLYYDPTLPPGWSRKVSQRMTGATAGGFDTYLIDPTGKRFRSKQEIRRHFEKVGEVRWYWEDFDFNPFGSKGQAVEEDKNIPFWEEDGDVNNAEPLIMDTSDFLKTEVVEFG